MPRKNKNNNSVSVGLWASLAATRLMLGFIFLWAFLDKSFGLGFSTPSERAWINGGSPTTGYLSNVDGMFASFFNGLAGNVIVDWLFMLGLFGVGIGLILGIAMRLSVVAGSLMLFLMWLAALPLATNPLIDDHLVYIGILAVLGFGYSLQRLSIGHRWRALPVVQNNSWLK